MDDPKWASLPFLHFVAGSQLHQLLDKSGVLVLGLMGAGKSTTIAVQQGAKLRVKDADDGDGYEIVASDVYTPCVSDGFESQTFNIGVFADKDQLYFDTAGLNEGRGIQQKQWTRFSLATAFSLLKEISCTLVVIDYRTSIGGRGVGLKDVATNLCQVIGLGETSKHFYRSMAFVVTNAFQNTQRISLERFGKDLMKFKKTTLESGVAKLEGLKMRYPLSTAQTLAAAASRAVAGTASEDQGSLGALLQHATGIDFEKAKASNDPDLIDLEQLKPVLALIDALEGALGDGRVFLSNPVDSAACKHQRDSVNAMIARCSKSRIEKQQLKEIVQSQVTDDLPVWNAFAAAAGSFNNEVSNLVKLRGRILKAVEEQSDKLRAIEQDWQTAKRSMAQGMEEEGAARQKRIERLTADIQAKGSSRQKVVFHKSEVRKNKEGNWWQWCWGTETAFHHFDYNLWNGSDPNLWYMEYDCKGSDYGKWEEKQEGSYGQWRGMSMKLESKKNCNLYVDVLFYRMEKDLPSTQKYVQDLREERGALEKEQQHHELKYMSLEVCKGEDDLRRFVLSGETELKKEVEAIETEFLNLIPKCPSLKSKADPPKLGHTLAALAQHLDMLRKAGAQPEILSPGSAASIADFLTSYAMYEKQKKELEKCTASKAILGDQTGNLTADKTCYQEMTKPIREKFSVKIATDWVGEHVPDLATAVTASKPLVLFMQQLATQSPGPLGAALVAFGLCSTFLGNVSVALGVFFLCKDISRRMDVVNLGVIRVLVALRADINRAMSGASGQATEGFQSARSLLETLLQGPPSQGPSPSGMSQIMSSLLQYGLSFFLCK